MILPPRQHQDQPLPGQGRLLEYQPCLFSWDVLRILLLATILLATPMLARAGAGEAELVEAPAPILVDTVASPARAHDFNEEIYYRNKLEYSTELGVLPINIPFVFDAFVGGDYTIQGLKYTMVPVLNSLRWHVDGIDGPWILRGNTDVTAALAVTVIPRGPESRYVAFVLGGRRNFIQRNWRTVPYFDFRLGMGNIDAQEPHGVQLAQGQDLTFTLMMGSGARYNFNSKYSLSAGANYMHVSNLYLSEPKYQNNGINVWGPWIGFNVRIGKGKHRPG